MTFILVRVWIRSPISELIPNPAAPGDAFLLYQKEDGRTRIQCRFEDETIWLSQAQIAVGFPDLHPGRGSPVGAAFVTEEVIYPHVIGGDIGCGMALFKTDLLRREAKLDRWAALRFNLEHP